MAALTVKPSDLRMEQRSMIKLLNFVGIPPKEIHRRLQNFYGVHGGQVVSVQRAQKWCREFSAGRKSVRDETRSGRPKTARTPHYVSRIEHLIKIDEQITIRDINGVFKGVFSC